jgi:hypothetical protein
VKAEEKKSAQKTAKPKPSAAKTAKNQQGKKTSSSEDAAYAAAYKAGVPASSSAPPK